MNFSAISMAMLRAWSSVDPQLRRRIIMRINLSLFLFFVMLTQISAKGYTQITIHKKNAPLESVLQSIESQSKYVFLFNEDELPVDKVNVNLKNASIEDVLNACFKDLPVTFKIVGKNILLKPAAPSIMERLKKAFTPPLDLMVKVTDETGNPLPGATVKIVGTNKTVFSDAKGIFQLNNIQENSSIEISFLGYETIRVKATSKLNIVQMKQQMAKLDEVVINKGYYSTTQKLNTGSAVKITSAELSRQPLTNPIQALQGLVPGMLVQQTSGMAGSGTTVQIRGRSSISSGTIPMYIVDGVPFNGMPLDQQTGTGQAIVGGQPNGSTDPLNNINPADIESITVLKDADATAIYGSRGANGVVLITTKRGGKGQPALSVNFSKGFGAITRNLEKMTSAEFLSLRRKAFTDNNVTPTNANAPDLLLWDQNANTDYQEMLIGNTAQLTDATASVAMGTEKSSILLSSTYHDEKSVLYGGSGYKRGGVNMRASHISDDNRFKLDIGANLTLNENNMPGSDFTSAAINMPANYPIYDAAGKLYWINNFSNPVADIKKGFSNKGNNTILSANMSYLIMEGLNFKVNLGYNATGQKQVNTIPSSSLNPLFLSPSQGFYSSNDGKRYIAEPQLDYKTMIGKGTLTATLGGAWQHSQNSMPYFVYASGFASEALMENYTNAASFLIVRSMESEYKYISGFGLLNYNLSDKYVLNAAFRRDGSSRFGPDRKYGNFGSVGAAWIFGEESFIKALNVFSFAKLRSSYGITGNDQTADYAYMDTYTSTTSSYGGDPGFYPTRIANPVFSWESNRKFEIATEMGFFNDKIRLTAAYFHNRSDNMIVGSSPLPGQTGFVSYTSNLNALVQNAGLEFDLKVIPIKSKEVNWDLSFNITSSKNKLINLPDELFSVYGNTYQVGQSLNSFVVYRNTGFVDGIAQIEDKNNNGVYTSGLTNDSYMAGSKDPKFYGGLASGLSYKRFRLDLLFNFVKQKGLARAAFPGLIVGQGADLLNSPFKPAPLASTTYPSYLSYTRYLLSDGLITDASFIRLRNLSLAYSLPQQWTEAVKARSINVFLRGQNLITITKYQGLDPETQGSVLPPLKMLTAGIQCSF